MGRYMKKGKITGGVAVMEVPQSALGVRTRAKTLALQQSPDVGYLQLRSRRLEKPRFTLPAKQENLRQTSDLPNRSGSYQNQSRRAGSRLRFESPKKEELEFKNNEEEEEYFCGFRSCEASFLENSLRFDGAERSGLEDTSCDIICGSGMIMSQRRMPSMLDMEDFFASIERQQREQFMDKYNFDVLNDSPLPGRYEWVSVDP